MDNLAESGRAMKGSPYLKLSRYLTKGTNQITRSTGWMSQELNISGPVEMDMKKSKAQAV